MKTTMKQIISGFMIYFMVMTQVFGQAALLPNAVQQYFDNNGKPLAAGKVEYYVPGTLTKKTTWQNSTETINNTNPVNLDIGGKGIMYGQGVYRQIVKDNLGNVIWDQPTSSIGSSAPSGATGTDTAPVGSVMAFAGSSIPTNWLLAYGQTVSRTTYPELLSAVTITNTNISCTNTSTSLTGFTDTSLFRIGAPIEATCLPTSTTISSITNATTIVVSNAAVTTSTVTATVFPWGNGDQVSTFNVPDLRGRAPVGADCMGYVDLGNNCAGNLTTAFYTTNPGAPGQYGGSQSKNLTIANINTFTPLINSITPTGTISTVTPNVSGSTGIFAFTGSVTTGVGAGAIPVYQSSQMGSASPLTPTFTGNTLTPTAQPLGSGTAHSVVQPSSTINYIIKSKPNATGAGGVISIGGMFGDILCGPNLICENQTINTFFGSYNNLPATTLATTTILPNTPIYNNGAAGVGATLTSSTNSTLTVDSVLVANGYTILVKDQADNTRNGIYTVTDAGSGTTPWILTRTTYFDQPAEMIANSITTITNGTINTNITFIMPTAVTAVGTSPVIFNSLACPNCALTNITNVFSAPQKINLNSAVLPTPLTGTALQVGQANSVATRIESDAFGAIPTFTCRRYDGTNAAPTAVQNNEQICTVDAFGYNGTASVGPNAAIIMTAAQNWAVGANGTYIDFLTTLNGTSTLANIARFENDKGITVPNTVTGGSKGAGTINVSGNYYINGVLVQSHLVNAQTGTNYAIVDGDRSKLITTSNAAAQAYTIAQAGAGGSFVAGWYTDLHNIGAGTVTITPTTSTINGAASFTLLPGFSVRIVSDGTNYQTAFSQVNPSQITSSLAVDVTVNATYTDGPSVAQGSSGTWMTSGTVTVKDAGGAQTFFCKIWDGTTTIASGGAATSGAGVRTTISLSGIISSPTGNLRISCKEAAGTGVMVANDSGSSKDSTITAYRIQ